MLSERTAAAVRDGFAPLVLGGDHSLGAGSVAGVATAFAERKQRIGLIWLDAHGDLNTPAVVRDRQRPRHAGGPPGRSWRSRDGEPRPPRPAVLPQHTVLVGVRDLDPAERENIRQFGVKVFTMRDVDERGLKDVMREAIEIATTGTAGFHLSCDADWVDPAQAPGVGTPVRGGATYREAHLAMEMVADAGKLVSMDIVEINPVLDSMNRTADLCVGLVTSAFGLRIL